MHRLMLSVSEPQIAYLRAEAKRLGISIAELLRRIIDEHREAKERERRE